MRLAIHLARSCVPSPPAQLQSSRSLVPEVNAIEASRAGVSGSCYAIVCGPGRPYPVARLLLAQPPLPVPQPGVSLDSRQERGEACNEAARRRLEEEQLFVVRHGRN
ncbi:unnamed protein product [Urochloa humidicola]